MQDLIKTMIEVINDRDYGTILKIVMGIFILIIPSTSYVFIYNRELFFNLEFTKLIFFCLFLNSVFLMAVFVFVIFVNSIKSSDINKLKKEYYEAKTELNKCESILKKNKQESKSLIKEIEGLDSIDCLENIKIKEELDEKLSKVNILINKTETEVQETKDILNILSRQIDESDYGVTLYDLFQIVLIFTCIIWFNYFSYMLFEYKLYSHRNNFIAFIFIIVFYIGEKIKDSFKECKEKTVFDKLKNNKGLISLESCVVLFLVVLIYYYFE
jgi:hypothetical protein